MATERKRIRWFIQGLDLKIQDALAAAQIETFSDVLDKAKRVKSTKSQLRTFQSRKRDVSDSSFGLPPNVRQGLDGERLPLLSPPMIKKPEGTISREAPVGQMQSREISQASQVTTVRLTREFCESTNHTEENG